MTEPIKEIAGQLVKSRNVKVVQVTKDLKPTVVDQRLREIIAHAKRRAASKTVMVISFEL